MIGWKISRHRSSSTLQPVSSHTRLLSPPRLLSPLRVVSCLLLWLAIAPGLVDGAELIRCRRAFNDGDYAGCIRIARSAIQANEYGESWPVLKAEAELATGRFESACTTIERGLKRYPSSIRLRWTGYFAFNHINSPRRAKTLLAEINTLAERSPWRYTDIEELLTLGHAALQVGADARVVLKGFFHRAKKLDPDHVGPDIAIGNLALDKHDAELAAEVFLAAIKRFPKNSDANFGLARALARSDPKRARQALASALAANPHHAPSLLLQAERNIDAENYDGAEAILRSIQAVNPRDPNAWALRTVIAHLQNDPKGAAAWYHAAHSSWKHNPAVDHLIGKKLSQHYRFLEGAVYQRRALSFEPNFAAARIQLAQDLLRLGREREGWKHAVEAHSRDGYDAVTFNLLELRDRIAKYTTLKNDGFIVRMDSREAVVYGRRVLRLLSRAKTELCRKYGLDLKHRITVEIFADENDFAVRTFGMPAVSGYLGVCFGRVITMVSPRAHLENPSNWRSVLWHEFCHVVTLELTRNRIPRWLSEGISVYEERQADPRWGQRMTPRYRQMVLDGELTPIRNLSSAFHAPKSAAHLQFAYYQSCLVVEFLVKNYGMKSLRFILRDIADGIPINTAIARRTNDLPEIELGFQQFARRRARHFGSKTDWTRLNPRILQSRNPVTIAGWLKQHPRNFYALTRIAQIHLQRRKWRQALLPLKQLIELCPDYIGPENAYVALADVYRELDEPQKEYHIISQYVSRTSVATKANLRLIELEDSMRRTAQSTANNQRSRRSRSARKVLHAEDVLAVNPFDRQASRTIAEYAAGSNAERNRYEAYLALLQIGPDARAEIHYQLARLLHLSRRQEARRHVLRALELAPRYRDAYRLLLELRTSPHDPVHPRHVPR